MPAYQSTVSPAKTLAVIAGIEPPEQYDSSPPLTGGAITGQLQFGAVTGNVFKQPLPSVTVSVIAVPDGTELIDHTLPPRSVTVPKVLVNTPELTVAPTEYVNKSVAHVAAVVIVIVGNGLTVITTLFDLLQPVAVIASTTVYVVVTVGLTVGFAAADVKPVGTEVQL